MTSKEILEKIKLLFNTETKVETKVEEKIEAKVEEVLVDPLPEEVPVEEQPEETVKIEERIKSLEDKIAQIESLLEMKDQEVKQAKVENEKLSKQITEKDELINKIQVELSATPISEPIVIEKQATKKANFSSKMIDKLTEAAKEKGKSY